MTDLCTNSFIAVGISVVAASIGVASSLLRAEESTADAVEHYRAAVSSLESAVFTSTWSEITSGTGTVVTTNDEWKIDVKNRRLWCMSKVFRSLSTSEDSGTNDKLADPSSVNERILSVQRMDEISVDEKTKTADRFTSYFKTPDDYWESNSGLGYLSFPFGYIKYGDSYASIPTLLDGLTTRRKGDDEIVLERSGDDYTLTVRLVPSKGWPASGVWLTSGDSPNQHLFSYQVDRFEKIGNSWFPVSYKCERQLPSRTKTLPKEIRIVDGNLVFDRSEIDTPPNSITAPAMILNTVVELSEVKLGELLAAPFEFQSTIPPGLSVSVQDAIHLDYVWLDGQVVPAADAMPELLGDERFVKGTGARPWLIYGNIAVALLLLGLYVVRQRSGRSSA